MKVYVILSRSNNMFDTIQVHSVWQSQTKANEKAAQLNASKNERVYKVFQTEIWDKM